MRVELITLTLLFGVAAAVAQEPIDLPQAIDYALAQNRELVRSALAIDSSGFSLNDARAEFQTRISPAVTAGVGAGQRSFGYGLRASKKLIWGTELIVDGGVLPGQSHGGEDLRTERIRLEVRQPIFRNFGSFIHREPMTQAGNDLKSARRRFELQKADLVVAVVQAYENIIRLRQQVRSDRESLVRMDALYRITKAKEVLARTTRIDTLRVELMRGQALARFEASQERLDSTQWDFAELLGFSPDRVFELQPPPLLEFEVPQPEESVRIALANRLDYAQALQDAEDADRGVQIARRKLLPDVKVIVGNDWPGYGPDNSDSFRLDENVWFAALSVDMDFNLTRERTALRQAGINQTSARQTAEIVGLSIARQGQQHVLAYRRAQAEARIAERNFELAVARAKLARRLFELGRGDNFSVTDAEVAFLQAENRVFSARAEASVSGYRLFRVLGTLIEAPADLKPDSLYRAR